MALEINELLASAMRFLPEAVVVTEARTDERQVVFANEAFERLTGYTLEEIKKYGLKCLCGPETDSAIFDRLLAVAPGGETPALELVLYRKDRNPFFDRVIPRNITSGGKVFCVQAHSDVSRNKEIENLLVLSQKREAAGHLVSGITHDFNNLLTAIMVYSGLVAARTQGEPQLDRYINEIHSAAQRGAQLVMQLLEIEREETAEPVVLDVGNLVQEMHDLMQRVLGEHVRLRIENESFPLHVKAPPGRLQQVLLNLGINARDAMPDGGDLVIRLAAARLGPDAAKEFPDAAEGNYATLSVTDTGTGMDAKTAASIFRPFFTTKDPGKGSGLGLYTVSTILAQLGGHIRVRSAPGKGTTFQILLPLAPESEATPLPKATLLLVEPADHFSGTILSAKGYRVLIAATREEAISVAEAYPGMIDVMITSRPQAAPEFIAEICKVRPTMKILFKPETVGDSDMKNLSPRPSGLSTELAMAEILASRIAELLNQPPSN